MDKNQAWRILIVDNDHDSIQRLLNQLKICQYHVIVETEAMATMKLLQNEKQKVDLIMIDAKMPGMEGRKLLYENVASLNNNIPFILLSSNLTKELVEEGVRYGACDFISKPGRPKELQNIWRHVEIRRKNDLKTKKPNATENINFSGKRKDPTNEKLKHGVLLKDKKPRMAWSPELHHKFVAIVDKIGVDNAVPKKILELMSDENLTRENVASHLQKYRLSLNKASQQAKKTTFVGGSSNPPEMQNCNGVVNDVQHNLSNGMSVSSHSIPSGVFSSHGVTDQWGQQYTSINDGTFNGFKMDTQDRFHGLSSVSQFYVAPPAEFEFVPVYPSSTENVVPPAEFVPVYPCSTMNVAPPAEFEFVPGFDEFHHEWTTQIQSPRMSSLTSVSDQFGACYANERELYELNNHHFWNLNGQLMDYIDPEFLSDGSTFLGEDFGEMNIADNTQIVNGGIMQLQQHNRDGYIVHTDPTSLISGEIRTRSDGEKLQGRSEPPVNLREKK